MTRAAESGDISCAQFLSKAIARGAAGSGQRKQSMHAVFFQSKPLARAAACSQFLIETLARTAGGRARTYVKRATEAPISITSSQRRFKCNLARLQQARCCIDDSCDT